MIEFQLLEWGNAFSYGANNVIKLNDASLTQLIGKNGNGKSSIALILEEGLFNTNSKKIKKADIINRYVKETSYYIKVHFKRDSDTYCISTTRSPSSSIVVLTRNGSDISSHTATGTYQSVENILGFDHKTFSQIIYQSSVSSLEFLTATDTARKKFLIELLNLGRYTKASEVFKGLASDATKEAEAISTKLNTINTFVTKYKKEDLTERKIVLVPKEPSDLILQAELLQKDIANIATINKKISNNNTYRKVLEGLSPPPALGPKPSQEDLNAAKVSLGSAEATLKSMTVSKAEPTRKCTSCGTMLDNHKLHDMYLHFLNTKPALDQEISSLKMLINALESEIANWNKAKEAANEWEKYYALVDESIARELLDEASMTKEFRALKSQVLEITGQIEEARQANTKAAAHNSKVAVVKGQLADMEKELKELQEELIIVTEYLTNLNILVKSFSNTGLIAYKIECLVKDLESLTNEYLSVLAGGRFQLTFVVNSSDKLNVVITDNGNDIDILALSSGERARVNISTLLAIRKLMQTLSNSRTNLLFLDETVENLDAEGKEKLIEVLLAEESLNTFLISHGFSHPLLEKLNIVKENNISRIE